MQVQPLAFSPKGDVLAVGFTEFGSSYFGRSKDPVRFVRVNDGGEAMPPLQTSLDTNHHVTIVRADFSPDGKFFAVLQVHRDNAWLLQVYDLASRSCVVTQTLGVVPVLSSSPDWEVDFSFAPDSSFIVTSEKISQRGSFDHRVVTVVDLATGRERFKRERSGFAVISPDAKIVATVDDVPYGVYDRPPDLKLWNARSGELIKTMEKTLSPGNSGVWPVFSPDGRRIALHSTVTRVYDTDSGRQVLEKPWGGQFLCDGTLVSVSGKDVQLWDVDSGKLKRAFTFDLGRHWDNGDQISPIPRAVPTRPCLAVFNYYPSRFPALLHKVGCLAGLNLFGFNRLTLLNADDGTRQTVELHDAMFTSSCIFSPAGNAVAVGFADGVVSVFDIPPRHSARAVVVAAAIVLLAGFMLARGRKQAGGVGGTT